MLNRIFQFRTGDAFRVEDVWLCGITSTPPQAEIHKTALGAEDSVSWLDKDGHNVVLATKLLIFPRFSVRFS